MLPSMRRVQSCVFVLATAGSLSRATPARAGGQPAARRVMDGEQLFRSYCAPCHGSDGKGRGPAAAALKSMPADLTGIAARNGGTFPKARVIRYVAEGEPSIPAHGSKTMPVWGPNFAALDP